MVEMLWIGVTGRKWVEQTAAFGIAGLVLAGVFGGLWLGFSPHLHAPALAATPWIVGLLLAMKFSAAVLVAYGLLRFRLTTARGVALMILPKSLGRPSSIRRSSS